MSNDEMDEVEEAAQRVPSVGDWGFSYCGDAPAAIGGGQAWLMWLASRGAMLAHLRDHAVYSYPAHHSVDPDEKDAEVKAVIAAAFGMPEETLRERLNAILKGVAEFQWVGSFDSMLASDDPFRRVWRANFRDDDDAMPIEADEVEEFAQFTRDNF
jgi:hypothetical protein